MGIDFEQERKELLAVQARGREAHVARDADMLVADNADPYIHVIRGKIAHRSQEEMLQIYRGYFQAMTSYEWEELEVPIIRISQDASMAWMITRTKVRQMLRDESGAETERELTYAGIMTYEKQDGAWVQIANVATFEPMDA